MQSVCNNKFYRMGFPDETHIPAIRYQPQAHPRISCAHADQIRRSSDPGAPGQGPGTSERLAVSARQRLPRTRRLTQAADFKAVLASRCKASGEYCQVHVKRNELRVARIGIVVPKKVLPRAVDRNYAKRVVREVFRTQRLPDLDVVVRVRKPFPRGQGAPARQELSTLLEKVKECLAGSSG